MMNFDEFREFIVDSIMSYLPAEYLDAEIKINKVKKDNINELTGLAILKSDDFVCPNIYLEDYYSKYDNGVSMDEILKEIVEQRILMEQITPKFETDINNNDSIIAHIVPKLINADVNKDMLKDRPYKEMEDLAISYRVVVSNDNNGISSTSLDDRIMKEIGLDVEQIHDIAIKNMKNIFPSKVVSMADILFKEFYDSMIADGMSKEAANSLLEAMSPQTPMYIITNEAGVNGAAAILDDDIMQSVREKLGDEVMLMPSSIHEFIAIPYDENDIGLLKSIVSDVNNDVVNPQDYLSDSVYKYDFGNKKLMLVGDSKERNIDNAIDTPKPNKR